MYRITDEDGNVLAQCDSPRYVRLKETTNSWIQCSAEQAECVAINGIRYSIAGRKSVDDAPKVVFITPLDGANELYNTTKATNANTSSVNDLGWAIQKMAEEIVNTLGLDESSS